MDVSILYRGPVQYFMRIHVTTSEAHLTSPDVPCKGVYNQAKAREMRQLSGWRNTPAKIDGQRSPTGVYHCMTNLVRTHPTASALIAL